MARGRKLKRPLPTILVSRRDRALLRSKWYVSATGYIRRMWIDENGKMQLQYLHRLIMNPPPGLTVDHINGNKADNRRSNLRICSQRENVRGIHKVHLSPRNKSGYMGVFRQETRWRAMIRVDDRGISLGMYGDPIEAAKAYDIAARKYFGETAAVNFP